MSSSEENLRSVHLRWTREGRVFAGGSDRGPRVTLDGDGVAGPSSTEFVLLGLAGCMGIDVLVILEKSRVPVKDLEVGVVGERAESAPRRFKSVRLTFRVTGPAPEDQAKLERAVQLSRDTYCSVLHTLRPDLDLDIRIERV
jgi:putative redox protein